jgi:tripartite-type tricarboxylate transporter receptor subunit TctC
MRRPDRSRLAAALLPLAAASGLWVPSGVRAQGFPARTVRMLVPTPPGSSVDVGARLIAERLRERLGQPVVVENRPGAGGTIAAAEVARAAPDGHTLVVGFNGPLATAGLLYQRLTYKPLELTSVIATVTQPHVMVVAGNHPAKTVSEFVERARAAPGRYNYASVGNASGSHLAMELFKSVAGLFIVHIPYNGGPAATQAVMSGEVDALFTALVNVQGQVAAGRLRVLGLAERERTPAAPGIATFAEQGFPQVVAPLFNAIAAPPGTPADVVQRLNADIAAVLAEPAVRQRLSAGGMEVIGGTPAQMAALTRAEVERWAPVVQRLQLTLD